jgi:hypothetical protein
VYKTVNIASGVGVQMQVYVRWITEDPTVLLNLLSSSTSLPSVEKKEGLSNKSWKFIVEMHPIHDHLSGCTHETITREDL